MPAMAYRWKGAEVVTGTWVGSLVPLSTTDPKAQNSQVAEVVFTTA
jgi:hypothetical protein